MASVIEQASPGTIFDLHRLSPKLGYSVDLDRFWLARPSSAECPQRIVSEKNMVPLQFGHSEMVFRRLWNATLPKRPWTAPGRKFRLMSESRGDFRGSGRQICKVCKRSPPRHRSLKAARRRPQHGPGRSRCCAVPAPASNLKSGPLALKVKIRY